MAGLYSVVVQFPISASIRGLELDAPELDVGNDVSLLLTII